MTSKANRHGVDDTRGDAIECPAWQPIDMADAVVAVTPIRDHGRFDYRVDVTHPRLNGAFSEFVSGGQVTVDTVASGQKSRMAELVDYINAQWQ